MRPRNSGRVGRSKALGKGVERRGLIPRDRDAIRRTRTNRRDSHALPPVRSLHSSHRLALPVRRVSSSLCRCLPSCAFCVSVSSVPSRSRTRGEDQSVLHFLMGGTVRPMPAQRIADQSGQHRRRREIPHRADLIDRHAPEGHQRCVELQDKPAMGHDRAASGRIFTQPARSASDPRVAPSTSTFGQRHHAPLFPGGIGFVQRH